MPVKAFLERLKKSAAGMADVTQQAAADATYIRDREKRMKKDLGMSPLEPYTERWKEVRSLFSQRKK